MPLLLEEFPIPSSRGNLVWPFRVSQIGEVGICFHELITHLVQQGILIDLRSKDFCKDFHWFFSICFWRQCLAHIYRQRQKALSEPLAHKSNSTAFFKCGCAPEGSGMKQASEVSAEALWLLDFKKHWAMPSDVAFNF